MARPLTRALLAAAFFALSSASVLAQSFTGVAPSGRVFANSGASAAPGSWVTATAWFDRAFCSVNDSVPVRQAGTWSCATIGSVLQAWDADLDAISALSGTGIAARTAANTWATRTLQAPAAGLTITNPAGVAGDPTFALANDLAALEGLAGTGIAVRSAANTWVQRSLANATAGITWTNGDGVAGNPTPVLANDLAAVEGLATTGCTARTAADTWNTRTVTGTANEITVTNGDCVAGNPTLSLPAALTFTGKTVQGGTYSDVALAGLVSWTIPLTATTITANQNNYTATDGSLQCNSRGVLRVSSDATRSVTGLSCGQADGALKVLHNVGSFDIVLSSEDALSTAANRFAFNSSTTLTPASAVTLRYDGTSSRWRPIAGAGSGGGGGGTVTSVAVSSTDLSVSGSPITTSGTITLNVANDAVTNAKLANMANSTIKCRSTAGTGDPEDCSIANVLEFAGSAHGSLLYRNASNWTTIGPGTSGQVLTTGGAGANPAWATQGMRLIASTDVTVAVGAVTFTGLGSCNVYQFEFFNVISDTSNVALIMEVGTGAGPTWQTSSYAYAYAQTNTSSATSGITSASAANILLSRTGADGIGAAAGREISGTVKAFGLSAGYYKRFTVQTGWRSSGFFATFPGAAEWQNGTAVTAVRFRTDSGNIADGTFQVYCLGQ